MQQSLINLLALKVVKKARQLDRPLSAFAAKAGDGKNCAGQALKTAGGRRKFIMLEREN
jgi:hypothetical protein